MTFDPTRDAGLSRLHDFIPRAARAYASSRNADTGPGDRRNVSVLSPWLHAGLVSESEVLEAVLAEHQASAADKFVSEVFWRIYFKGYLEQRPSIWAAYKAQRDAAVAALDSNAGMRKAWTEAVEGRTGIDAFDYWARELVDTGYLHNHARMWFASIWIFTLKLDWTLGADFFLRHLADGDAASNTLSWRWVAGLHTKGKTYLARKSNIARYTADHPEGPLAAENLASSADALTEDVDHARQPIDFPEETAIADEPFALILHDEAASHVPLKLDRQPALVIGGARPDARSDGDVGDIARRFANEAVAGGIGAAAEAFDCSAVDWAAGTPLSAVLEGHEIERIVIPYVPVGWTRDALASDLDDDSRSLEWHRLVDPLDRATWPHARAGFFGVKKKMAAAMREAGVAGA